jgi:aryl-alcohol dehydrogenase-like predicted oxidoreductase
MKRREFMERSLVAAGALTLGGAVPTAEPARRLKSAVDRVPLGKTGLTMPFLGIGTGTVGTNHASNQTRMGQEAFTRLIRHAYDQGVRYLDCADSYGSHAYVKEAIKGLPREAFFIQTKIINRTPEEAKADLERFRKEMGSDYFDSVLIHVVTRPTWVEDLKGVRDVLSDAKAKGIVKAHGVSCHSLGALKAAADSPWVQVDLARLNPKGAHMDASPEVVCGVLEKMHDAGKGVIGMKIMGQGDLTSDADRDVTLRFALSQRCMDAMVVGFEKPEQIDDVIRRVNAILAEGSSTRSKAAA